MRWYHFASILVIVLAVVTSGLLQRGVYLPISCHLSFSLYGCPVAVVHGTISDARFERVRDVFSEQIAEGHAPAQQLVVYEKGVRVVDLWGSFDTIESSYGPETMTAIFSSGKVLGALSILSLVDSGQIASLHDKIASYWPDFTGDGREDITVSDVLRHQSGFHVMEGPVPLWERHILNQDGPTNELHGLSIRDVLLNSRPKSVAQWSTGDKPARAYHGLIKHWLEREIVQHADPEGRTDGDVLRSDVLGPLGVNKDVHVRLPPSSPERARWRCIETVNEHPHHMWLRVIIPFLLGTETNHMMTTSQIDGHPTNAMINGLDVSCGGKYSDMDPRFVCEENALVGDHTSWGVVANARGLGKVIAMLSLGGRHPDHPLDEEKRILSEDTFKRAMSLSEDATREDVVLGETTTFTDGGFGNIRLHFDSEQKWWGWMGWSGSLVQFDSERELAIAYVPAAMDGGDGGLIPDRTVAIWAAIDEALRHPAP